MAYITQQELINLHLSGGARIETGGMIPAANGAIVWDLIQADINSEQRQQCVDGSNYFNIKNSKISGRKKTFSTSAGDEPDTVHSNRKLIHAFLPLLILQKIGVLLGKPVRFVNEKKELDEIIDKFRTDEFHELLKEWTTTASYAGVAWLHFFPVSDIDDAGRINNKLEYMLVPPEQIVAIRNNRYDKNLTDIIRYYTIDYFQSRDQHEKLYRAEWWNSEKVTTWEQVPGKSTMAQVNSRPHLQKSNETAGGTFADSEIGWGFPPFVDLLNNPFQLSDLQFIKTLVDDYDFNSSDSSNDLADMVRQLLIIKGYPGDMAKAEDQAKAITNIRNNSAVFLNGDDGDGVESLDVTIQYEARDNHLQRMKKDIYHFGMGVDLTDDKLGNNPSGTSLKFHYAPLFMKADLLISGISKVIRRLWDVEAQYSAILGNKKIESFEDVEIVIEKSDIDNDSERIKMVNESAGHLSDETIYEKHPLVDDSEREIERKQLDRDKNKIEFDDSQTDE